MSIDRRLMLGSMAAAGAALALPARAAAQADGTADPELARAFAALLAPETRATMLAEGAIVIDSDAPFPMARADHLDHLAFHQPLWESRSYAPYQLRTRAAGETGIVTAYLMDRGKPKGAGFRLRPSYATAVFTRTPAGWRALSLHIGALAGQIAQISPG